VSNFVFVSQKYLEDLERNSSLQKTVLDEENLSFNIDVKVQ